MYSNLRKASQQISVIEHDYSCKSDEWGNIEKKPLRYVRVEGGNDEKNSKSKIASSATKLDCEEYQLKELMIEPVINVVETLGVTFRTNISLEEICKSGHLLEITPIDYSTVQRELCHVSRICESCKVCLRDLSDSVDKILFCYESGEVNNEIINISTELQLMNIEIPTDKEDPQQLCIDCFGTFSRMRHFRQVCNRSKDVLTEISEFTAKQLESDVKFEADIEFLNIKSIVDTIEIKEEQEDNSKNFNSLDEEIVVDHSFDNPYDHPFDNPFDIKNEVNIPNAVDYKEPENHQINKSLECSRCGCDSIDFNSYIYHRRYDKCVDEKNPKCRICDETLPNIPELDRHNCFSCEKCWKTFSTLSKYNRHLRYHETFICDFCSDIFYTKRAIREHLKSHIVGLYPCVFCNERFMSTKRLGIHKRSVHPNELYKCPHCAKEYRLKDTFRCHFLKHNPDKPHKCTYCDKQFVFRHHWENHLRTHTKVNPFLCNFCGKSYRGEEGLKTHMTIHDPVMYPQRKSRHALNKKTIQCDMCDYSSNQSGNMKKHKIRHHNFPTPPAYTPGVFEFSCHICDKEFKLSTSLENHVRTHNEVRDYHCPLCKASFRKPTYLRLHIDGVHLKLRPNKCNQCDAAYLMSNDLRRHKMQKHSSERKFECYQCRKTFTFSLYLKNHINRVHSKFKLVDRAT